MKAWQAKDCCLSYLFSLKNMESTRSKSNEKSLTFPRK
jgi:hypothetical protein